MLNLLRDLDFFGLDELLSPEEKMTKAAVREFVEHEVIPDIERHFESGSFPMNLVPRMGELGLLGAHLVGYGCAGVSSVGYGVIMQELEAGDSGLRSFASVQGALSMNAIHAFGSEEQKRRYLPGMARGKIIGCFALTEPDHGSDPAGMETRARRDGAGWVLSGTKRWITNGSVADVAIVWARVEEGFAGFVVDKEKRGLSARDITGKFSMRASVTSELVLDEVRVAEGDRLPGARGLGAALSCLGEARYGIAWGAVGAARTCYNCALDYAKSRRQFKRTLAGYQLVQEKLVGMLSAITKAQLLCLRLGRLKEAGAARPEHISLAKRDNAAAALEVARTARDILGANGIVTDYPVIRHMLNLETVSTYEGTFDIHTLILGRHITGESAFD